MNGTDSKQSFRELPVRIMKTDNAHSYILSSLFRYIMVSLYKKLFSPVSTNDEEKDLEIQSKIRLEIVYGS